jgi:hypothetical protein
LTLYKAHPKSAGDSSMEISSMYIWCEKNMESYCTPNCRWRLSFQLLESRKQKKTQFHTFERSGKSTTLDYTLPSGKLT